MALVYSLLLAVAMCVAAVLASKEHHGIIKAITSTGNSLQQHEKYVGSAEHTTTTTETITADLQQLGRQGVLPQLNKQQCPINDSHTARLTETGLLILDSVGNVEQSIGPLTCSPLELIKPHGGIDGGSSRKVIILLIMCRTNGQVLSLIDFDGRYIVQPYETAKTHVLLNAVAVTMSTDSTPTATGLAFLQGNTLLHRPYLVSAHPVILDVTSSPLNCQQPSLASLNSSHYLLLCTSSWHSVDKDGKTALVGPREPGSVISSSRHGKVVVSSTDTQVNVLTHHLTQSCPLEIDGQPSVDFVDVSNTTLVLFFTSKGVYKHNISSGCPSSTPSLVTMAAPVCLVLKECYGYYFSEDTDSELLFVTSRSSNPNKYDVEAYDITTNTSLMINFVLSNLPLLLQYQPLPPLPPSPSPSTVTVTVTTTALVVPSPSQTPSTNPIKPHHIVIIVMVGVVLILGSVLTILIGVCVAAICKRCRRKRGIQLGDNNSRVGTVGTELSSLDSNDQHRAPVEEVGMPVQVEEDITSFQYSLPATPRYYQQPPHKERGPNQPAVCVATRV